MLKSVNVGSIIWACAVIVSIWGLGCYGVIKIFHSPTSVAIFMSFLIILFLFAVSIVGKMYWDIRQERKTIEESLTVNDNDPKIFLKSIQFYSTLNYRDNARTNIARAREIGKRFVGKILSEERNFLSDYNMIELIVLLGRLDMEEEALQCLQYHYDRKTYR